MADELLGRLTMYRSMLYYLIFLVLVSAILSYLKILSLDPVDILVGSGYLVFICWVSNRLFANIFKVKTNPESALITGLILSLIFGPVSPLINPFIGFAGVVAMASKYLFIFQKKHIFNPAAFGAVASAIIFNQGASWWIGNLPMTPFILLGGFLILKKLRRLTLVVTFFLSMIFAMVAITILDREPIDLISWFRNLSILLFISPLAFFALVMLIEPLTSPYRKLHQTMYATLVAFAYYPLGLIGNIVYYPLEMSLLIGNVFAYIVNGSFRQVLILKKKEKLSYDVTGFWFEPWKKFQYSAGQYLQWSLSHKKPDSRGIRRFFTIASSPTEDLVLLASKFYENKSTFKQTLENLKTGDEIIASNLEGEFILPKNQNVRLMFIAGGIGITPFRSMAKWMLDQKEHRDIILLHSNKTQRDILFKDIFKKAAQQGWKTIYVNTDTDGYVDENMIKEKVPDWKQRLFFISGPEPMVEAFEKMLYGMGLKKSQVKRDYFEGYTETHQK